MKFGGGDDSSDPARMEDVTPFHRELIEEWLEENKTTDDIKRELNNVGESDAAFWGEYREIYEPFATVDGSGADAFLDTLDATPYADDEGNEPERPTAERRPTVFDLGDGSIHEPEQRVPPVRPTPAPTPQNPVSPTPVPSPGWGGGDKAGKPGAVVRVARRIGRWLGFGRNKK